MDRLAIASSRSTTRGSIELLYQYAIDVTPIADKLLNTVYSSVKTVALPRFKVDNSVRVNKFKMIYEKDYTPNWTTEMFRIVKVQRTNPITYLLENYRGKPVTERFYEYELHRVANSDVYLIKKI